ncbi:MAG: helix-turn-helix domain-containing protein [Pseudomonadota bacterium]
MYVTLSGEHRSAFRSTSRDIATAPPHLKLAANSALYFEGDEVSHVYIIEDGVVRLTRVLEDGRRQVIAFGYPGDIVGFPARGLHNTDCDALTPVRLRPIRRCVLEDGAQDPDLHAALLDAAMDEISAMQDHFMMLGCKNAPEKVASFIKSMADRHGMMAADGANVHLPMGRADIADFLGLTMETVSRCFTALRKDGVIRLNGAQSVVIVSMERLARHALGQNTPAPRERHCPTLAA